MSDEFGDKFTVLIEKYRAQLPGEVDKLEGIWVLLAQDWQEVTFNQFAVAIHALSGTAGMFGFEAFSATANAIQVILRSAKKAGVLSDEEKDQIKVHLATLHTLRMQLSSEESA